MVSGKLSSWGFDTVEVVNLACDTLLTASLSRCWSASTPLH